MPLEVSDICKFLLALIFPPLGVFLEVGLSQDFWINVILTLFGFIPGIIHACFIITKY
ncbi:plasma membrane proteolipid Pmp3 [Sorochytrium milnesiophthora]